MNNYLLITLGHGSSAIFIYDNGKKIIGYEQERLSGIKADSQFPKDAINEIINNVGLHLMQGCKIFISHWFNDCTDENNKFSLSPNKYVSSIDLLNLREISNDIVVVDKSFTHHDAHAYSALAFFEYNWNEQKQPLQTKNVYTLVADGFGTNEEVLSIYSSQYEKDHTPKLIHRVYGYEASVGLMYQYATSFCGMKENQDEYKFLGYESHIDEYINEQGLDTLNHFVEENIKYMYDNLFNNNTSENEWSMSCSKNDLINFEKLQYTKEYWHSKLNEVVQGTFISANFSANNKEEHDFVVRCVVAYFIQQSIELYFTRIINDFEISNTIVVGGCFFNVKLNNHILQSTQGLFCAMPLAGDQGAAIGMLRKFTDLKFSFDNLAFGKRRLYNIEKSFGNKEHKGIFYRRMVTNTNNFKAIHRIAIAKEIASYIADGYIVNLIFGDMEFGPRALCNTSTLFLPTVENVAHNNHMNNRNEVMPCAPVVTIDNAPVLFDVNELNRVVGSDRFMICTHDYMREYSNQYGGVMHKKTLENKYTGRPQVVRDFSFMYYVLTEVQERCDARCLVNTSFNAHGRPIAFDTTEILQNFEYQREHALKEPLLFVIDLTDEEN